MFWKKTTTTKLTTQLLYTIVLPCIYNTPNVQLQFVKTEANKRNHKLP